MEDGETKCRLLSKVYTINTVNKCSVSVAAVGEQPFTCLPGY